MEITYSFCQKYTYFYIFIAKELHYSWKDNQQNGICKFTNYWLQ